MSNVTYKIDKIDESLGHVTVTFSLGKESKQTTFCDISLTDVDAAKEELNRRAQGWADGIASSTQEVDPKLAAIVGKAQTVPEVE